MLLLQSARPTILTKPRSIPLCYNIPAEHIFWKNVRWQIGSGRYILIQGAKHVAVEDCRIDATAANHGAFYFLGGIDLTFIRNFVHYKSGRMWFANSGARC